MALLGFLLLHRDAPQRREYIATQFWPESTETQARTNLRRELHALRAGLPQASQWLVAEHGTLLWRLDGGCRLDVADFEAAAESAATALVTEDPAGFRQAAAAALHAYRGELMPAVYDDWVQAERERLHRKCVTLLDQLIVAERSARAYGAAIERARWRIDLEPLEEAGYRTLLQLPAQSGDRAAALQTYHRLVSLLERELGVAPDPATTAEYERLASQRPAGPPPAAPTPAAPVPAPGVLRLVGREQEFRLLHGRWQRALHGAAGFAVLAGDAGVGKTRLLDELCAVIQRDGGQVMRARCFRARGAAGAGPSVGVAAQPGDAGRPRPLDPVWAHEVDRLVPRRDAGPATRCARWPTPGSGTGSSRAWPAPCCPPGGPRCWCWMTSSGAMRTPWPGCSSCCTWAGMIRCWWWRLPGGTRWTAMPSSLRHCGCCGPGARSPR